VKGQYLGDSYDAVKRLWQEVLAEWAPLHAEPRFIPEDIRNEFTAFTRIPLLNECRPMFYAILNDPDTGVRPPNCANQSEGRSHIALPTIREQLRNAAVQCVITFDQSNHREPGLSPKSQRNKKLRWLGHERLSAFYRSTMFLMPHSCLRSWIQRRWIWCAALLGDLECQPIALRGRSDT